MSAARRSAGGRVCGRPRWPSVAGTPFRSVCAACAMVVSAAWLLGCSPGTAVSLAARPSPASGRFLSRAEPRAPGVGSPPAPAPGPQTDFVGNWVGISHGNSVFCYLVLRPDGTGSLVTNYVEEDGGVYRVDGVKPSECGGYGYVVTVVCPAARTYVNCRIRPCSGRPDEAEVLLYHHDASVRIPVRRPR